jgi:hypothetical protein
MSGIFELFYRGSTIAFVTHPKCVTKLRKIVRVHIARLPVYVYHIYIITIISLNLDSECNED